MITIGLVVTIPATDFSNCESFSILTKKNEHRGYLQFQGATEELALQVALKKIRKITGWEFTAKKIKCDDLACLFYHVHFSSSKIVSKKLLETKYKPAQRNVTPLRATRSSKISRYQFIERNSLSLLPAHADYVKKIYQTIYRNLYEIPKQEVNVNCGSVSGRSADYDSATQGSTGYSFLCENNLLLKQVYYFFYSYYNRNKKNIKGSPVRPVILNQLPDSPNTRSPGGRIYRNFFGMGTTIYVLDQTTGTESKSVINLSLLVKTGKTNGKANVLNTAATTTTEFPIEPQTKRASIPTIVKSINPDHPDVIDNSFVKTSCLDSTDLTTPINEPFNETLEIMQLKNKDAQNPNNHTSSKSSNTNFDKNKEKLRAFLEKEQAKAPLFYHQIHNVLLTSSEDNEYTLLSDDESSDFSQDEDYKIETDLVASTEDNEDILFSDDDSELSQDEDSKNEIDLAQKAILTGRKLENCKKEKEKNGKKRSPGQNEIFNSSAKNAALACGLPRKFIYEWTHLIAHEFIGNTGQKKENLVLATSNCNTAMMHLELVIKKLILAGHTINIKVSAQADNSTSIRTQYHCVKSISYLLIIDGKEINFNFDPYLEITPPKNLWRAMLASVVWELIKPVSDENNTDYNALEYNACKMDLATLKSFLKSSSVLPKIVEHPKASSEILTTPIKPLSLKGADHSTFFNTGKRKIDAVEHEAIEHHTKTFLLTPPMEELEATDPIPILIPAPVSTSTLTSH